MQRLAIALIAVLAVAAVGCKSDDATASTDAPTTPPAANPGMAAKPGAQGGQPELGQGEMSPGISGSEADARVGSANKGGN